MPDWLESAALQFEIALDRDDIQEKLEELSEGKASNYIERIKKELILICLQHYQKMTNLRDVKKALIIMEHAIFNDKDIKKAASYCMMEKGYCLNKKEVKEARMCEFAYWCSEEDPFLFMPLGRNNINDESLLNGFLEVLKG